MEETCGARTVCRAQHGDLGTCGVGRDLEACVSLSHSAHGGGPERENMALFSDHLLQPSRTFSLRLPPAFLTSPNFLQLPHTLSDLLFLIYPTLFSLTISNLLLVYDLPTPTVYCLRPYFLNRLMFLVARLVTKQRLANTR